MTTSDAHPHPYTQSTLRSAGFVYFPDGKNRISQEIYLNLKKDDSLVRQEQEQTYCEDDQKQVTVHPNRVVAQQDAGSLRTALSKVYAHIAILT